MSFAWEDNYDTRVSDCREEKRAMETDNKKSRASKKKEWVGNVRRLAAFVQKRDQRWVKYVAEVEAKQEDKRKQELERIQINKKAKKDKYAEFNCQDY
jgi:DnaJ family protein A protein 5